jgi:hypothetical protein
MYDPVTHGGGSSALSRRRVLVRKSYKSLVDTEGLFNGLKGGQQFYLRHEICSLPALLCLTLQTVGEGYDRFSANRRRRQVKEGAVEKKGVKHNSPITEAK